MLLKRSGSENTGMKRWAQHAAMPRPTDLYPKSSDGARTRQNRPDERQQFLKPARGTTRAWVVTTELLEQFLFPVNDLMSALHARLRREAFSSLTARLESTRGGLGS